MNKSIFLFLFTLLLLKNETSFCFIISICFIFSFFEFILKSKQIKIHKDFILLHNLKKKTHLKKHEPRQIIIKSRRS